MTTGLEVRVSNVSVRFCVRVTFEQETDGRWIAEAEPTNPLKCGVEVGGTPSTGWAQPLGKHLVYGGTMQFALAELLRSIATSLEGA